MEPISTDKTTSCRLNIILNLLKKSSMWMAVELTNKQRPLLKAITNRILIQETLQIPSKEIKMHKVSKIKSCSTKSKLKWHSNLKIIHLNNNLSNLHKTASKIQVQSVTPSNTALIWVLHHCTTRLRLDKITRISLCLNSRLISKFLRHPPQPSQLQSLMSHSKLFIMIKTHKRMDKVPLVITKVHRP